MKHQRTDCHQAGLILSSSYFSIFEKHLYIFKWLCASMSDFNGKPLNKQMLYKNTVVSRINKNISL